MELIEKIVAKTAKISVIGPGYVGMPLAIEFGKAGFFVAGFDGDPQKVKVLKESKSYISYIPSERIKELIEKHSFIPTTDFSKLKDVDCIIICVPTTLNKNRELDLSYVFNTTRTIAKYLRQSQLVVLESTTYPGTTDEDMRTILEETGLKVGRISISPSPHKGSIPAARTIISGTPRR